MGLINVDLFDLARFDKRLTTSVVLKKQVPTS